MPKDYVSNLTIIENGKDMVSKRIEVNDPLFYGKFNFYQSSYQEMAPLKITDRKTGNSIPFTLRQSEVSSVGEFGLNLRLDSFSVLKGSMFANITVAPDRGMPYRVMLNQNMNAAASQSDKPYILEFSKDKPAYTTGLQVVADPGVGMVWAGSFLMVLGLFLLLYYYHRSISVKVVGNKILLTALAQKNLQNYKLEIESLLKNAGLNIPVENKEA